MRTVNWHRALEEMPDGTRYADLLPDPDLGAAPVSSGVTSVPPAARSWSHSHTDTEMFAVVAGEGVIEVGEERRPVSRGDVIGIPPLHAHSIENTGGGDLEVVAWWWRDPATERAALVSRAGGVIDSVAGATVVVMPAFPTPNGDVHVGHLAGPYLAADVLARAARQQGAAVHRYCGVDQYQTYVATCFEDPVSGASTISDQIEASFARAGIEFDCFLRPLADDDVQHASRSAFERLAADGVYELRRTRVPYDPETDEPLVEAAVSGRCPHCAAEMTGLACEQCGAFASEDQLLDPCSSANGRPAELREVERYVLRLERFRSTITEFADRCHLSSNLREFMARVLGAPLAEVPVTHPGRWGLQVGDAGRLYTHCDEPAFLTSVARRLRLHVDQRAVWLFGIDNAFLYCVLTPVLYRVLDLAWPRACHANYFYRLDGEKFSTSRGHLVRVTDAVERLGSDWLRVHLAETRPDLAETDFTLDGATQAIEARRARWSGFVREVVVRCAAIGDSATVEAGVWTPRHVAAFNALDEQRRAAGRAADPDCLSLPALVAALDATVEVAVALRAAEPGTSGTETFDSQERTTIALELAAARQLAVLLAPLAPGVAARVAEAIGLGTDPASIPWSRALELVCAGRPLAAASPLDGSGRGL